MAVKKKKTIRTKKTKQKGGLPEPLSTIFKDGPPNTINKVLLEPNKLAFIEKIKKLLLSQQYQENVPVFYGNQLANKTNGYNEYICKTILGRFGSISSRRRIFIINPFAALVYRIYILCRINYNSKINILENLLIKLLKLDTFKGFPNLIYLPYGIRFCIVKDKNGEEKVITSLNANYSRCNSVSGCSLIMSAEIRKENLPSDEDIIELFNILDVDRVLYNYYDISTKKLLENIYDLLVELNKLQYILTKSNIRNNNEIVVTKQSIHTLYNYIIFFTAIFKKSIVFSNKNIAFFIFLYKLFYL